MRYVGLNIILKPFMFQLESKKTEVRWVDGNRSQEKESVIFSLTLYLVSSWRHLFWFHPFISFLPQIVIPFISKFLFLYNVSSEDEKLLKSVIPYCSEQQQHCAAAIFTPLNIQHEHAETLNSKGLSGTVSGRLYLMTLLESGLS